MKPLCLSIGGLDPSAGAGILLDIKVFAELNVRGLAIASVLTSQTTDRVYQSSPISGDLFLDQLKRIFDTYRIDAIKIGLISPSQIELLLAMEEFRNVKNKILDPILKSSSGHEFLSAKELYALAEVSSLVLPNYQEGLELLGISTETTLKKEEIVRDLKDRLGSEAVLLKGGHFNSSTDLLAGKGGVVKEIVGVEARSSMQVHGTGCLLSSAVTANLSYGMEIEVAVIEAKNYLSRKLSEAEKITGDEKFSFSFE